jgi:hypothetical protein
MDEQIFSGMNRLGALLRWWGLSAYENRGGLSEQFVQLQNFVAEVQKASLDAASRHMEAIFDTNERLARSAYDLLNGGKQSELSPAHTQIVSIVLEAAAQHARTWAEFQRKLQEIHAASTRVPADKAVGEPGSAAQQVKSKRSGPPTDEKLIDAA